MLTFQLNVFVFMKIADSRILHEICVNYQFLEIHISTAHDNYNIVLLYTFEVVQ